MVMAERPNATRSRTPIKVGFYDIIRTIGRGNFAVVKLARHRITKTEVAIKIIDKMRLDQTNLKKIYREIQILKLLNHQHIIKLYQVMETSSTIYLVCEYARNGELFDYITEQGRLPEDKARRMFWQVLTAVEYCHKNNVVHRDLKAENLLLDSNNNIKLADFGFSNFFQSGNMLSTWCGSPPYAAPEVFEGKVYEGTQLDVWSLGVVLYVLVCGTFPFDGSNLATLKERVLGGRFRIPYWMSQDCENLVRRMLVTNPKKRLTISQIKKHKWMQAHGTTLILSHTKSSPQLPRRGRLSEYNEHVLKVMHGFGINQQKTIESLQLSAYDHLYAIYHLLVDRLKMHRTSFPLDISYESGRRRPSNVADQALASMTHATPQPTAFPTSSNYPEQINRTQQESCSTDVQFDDITSGLPTVHRTLPNPVRYSSPPLPKITTSLYEEEKRQEEESVPYIHDGTPHNPSYSLCQNMIQPSAMACSTQVPHASRFLSSSYGSQNSDTAEVKLGKYNLQQRRHTLMVPNLSQIQMLSVGMSSGGQISPQLSPHSSTVQLSKSGNEMCTNQGLSNSELSNSCSSEHKARNEENTCISAGSQSDHMGLNYAKRGIAFLPSKNLQLTQKFTFDQQKSDARPTAFMQRRSGVSPLVCNTANQAQAEGAAQGEDQQLSRFPAGSRQRQLNTSPIGFREGRRASDGLLLLGDNLLKEHLQKLARAKGVPEMTVENSEESWKSDGQPLNSNQLHVPNQVNRCSSGERQQQTSPTTTPVGSGGNIYFQPYSNSQSLARRRSLQVQHLQSRANTSPKPEIADMCATTEHQQHMLNMQTSPYPDPAEQTFIRGPEGCTNFQWSSWKSVHGVTTEDNVESNPGTWQQLGVIRSGMKWNQDESPLISMTTMSVASDEAVPSKAAAAMQQQQRECLTKPIRQQSLPITPTSTNHPFGTAHTQHNPSLAQVLQQRRLQRRLKVATHQQQNSGYQLPLPELEQLHIDNTEMFPHFQNFSTQNIEHVPAAGLNDDASSNWVNQGLYYATALHAEAIQDCLDINEPMLPIPGQYPLQETLAYQNQQPYLDCHKIAEQTARHSSPQPFFAKDKSVNPELTWMLESAAVYQNTLSFNRQISAEKITNSTELTYGSTEAMEFALY